MLVSKRADAHSSTVQPAELETQRTKGERLEIAAEKNVVIELYYLFFLI
jgi:hypothetical protein